MPSGRSLPRRVRQRDGTHQYKREHSAPHLYKTDEVRAAFDSATERISAMRVQYVVEEDDVRQALLEIYAAVQLDTPYNSFRTT